MKTDYEIAKTNFEQNFKTRIPSRVEWAVENLDVTFDTKLYTDGSKMDCGVGVGVYSPDLSVEKSFDLPGLASVFQAETFAIMEAAKHLHIRARTQECKCGILLGQPSGKAAVKELNKHGQNTTKNVLKNY